MTIYTSFQDQEKYEHVGSNLTSAQDGKRSQVDDKRLCLVDDLKMLKDHIQDKFKETSSSLKSKDHYIFHKTKGQLLHKKDSISRQEASAINDQSHKERSL